MGSHRRTRRTFSWRACSSRAQSFCIRFVIRINRFEPLPAVRPNSTLIPTCKRLGTRRRKACESSSGVRGKGLEFSGQSFSCSALTSPRSSVAVPSHDSLSAIREIGLDSGDASSAKAFDAARFRAYALIKASSAHPRAGAAAQTKVAKSAMRGGSGSLISGRRRNAQATASNR